MANVPILSETAFPESLFLDITIQEAVSKTAVMHVVEPWSTEYVDALREGRYADAIWARYHIGGDVIDGVIPGSRLPGGPDITVLESIEEDAMEYWESDKEGYAVALAFYTQTADLNEHQEVIDLLVRCGEGECVFAKGHNQHPATSDENQLCYC